MKKSVIQTEKQYTNEISQQQDAIKNGQLTYQSFI